MRRLKNIINNKVPSKSKDLNKTNINNESIKRILENQYQYLRDPDSAPQLSTKRSAKHPLHTALAQAEELKDEKEKLKAKEEIYFIINLFLAHYIIHVTTCINYPITPSLKDEIAPKNESTSRIFDKLQTINNICATVHTRINQIIDKIVSTQDTNAFYSTLTQIVNEISNLLGEIYYDKKRINDLKTKLQTVINEYSDTSANEYKRFVLGINNNTILPKNWNAEHSLYQFNKFKLESWQSFLPSINIYKQIQPILNTLGSANLTLEQFNELNQKINDIDDLSCRKHIRALYQTYQRHHLNEYAIFIGQLASQTSFSQLKSQLNFQTFPMLKKEKDFIISQEILTLLQRPHEKNKKKSAKNVLNSVENARVKNALDTMIEAYFNWYSSVSSWSASQSPTTNYINPVKRVANKLEKKDFFILTPKKFVNLINEMKKEINSNKDFQRQISFFCHPFYLKGKANGIQKLKTKLNNAKPESIKADKFKIFINELQAIIKARPKSYSCCLWSTKVRSEDTQAFYDTWTKKLESFF